MSIFNFNGGTLLASNSGYGMNDNTITIEDIPEDMHVINTTNHSYLYSSKDLPSHAVNIVGGVQTSVVSPYFSSDSIFNINNGSDTVFSISKTTNNVDIEGILTAGSYGGLPKWVTNITKASATSLKLSWNDGTTSTLNLTTTNNVTGKIRYVIQNLLASISITADSIPYNGTITLSSIDTNYGSNTSTSFTVGNQEGDEYLTSSFYTEYGQGTNNSDVSINVYNSSGTYLGSLNKSYVTSVNVKKGSIITISNGTLISIK